MYDENFYNAQKSESYESAKNMLGIIYEQIIKPKSVVDVGCGVGTWLRPWQNLANKDGKECQILGIDGNEVGDELFYIDRKYFKRLDLTAPAKENLKELGGKKFDLAQCLEVGEHFSEEYAENFASFLCSLSDLLLFSGAIPHQGGTHHVNCREPAYWAELFARHDFACFDILRQPLWQHGGIAYYYRQNAVLYAKAEAKERLENLGFKSVAKPLYIIHPQMWELRNREFSRIYQAYLRLSADLVELKGISGGKFS